jgi:hypothetical protein
LREKSDGRSNEKRIFSDVYTALFFKLLEGRDGKNERRNSIQSMFTLLTLAIKH